MLSRAPARDRLAEQVCRRRLTAAPLGRPLRLRLPILLAAIGLVVPVGAARAAGGETLSLSQISPGMSCTGQTVIQGTTISSFDVHVISVVESPGEGPRILVQVSGPAVDSTGVAEGFSGSPVYCPDGLGGQGNIGAISEGIGQYRNNVVPPRWT
jgi:hypothetical protein